MQKISELKKKKKTKLIICRYRVLLRNEFRVFHLCIGIIFLRLS